MTSALPSQSRHRSTVARIYLSYSHADFRGKFSSLAREIKAKLPESRVFWDEEIPFGVNRKDALDEELERADIVVIFCGENSLRSDHIKREVNTALRSEKQVVPVLLTDHASWEDLPSDLQNIRGARLDTADWSNHLPVLIGGLQQVANRVRRAITDPEDPQRGRWGGQSRRDGRELTASVRPKSENWFAVELRVRSVERSALTGLVEFHLHDSFDPDVEKVLARDGEASLLVHAYGAFTVGALLEDGTTLELDLASLSDASKTFRER